MKPLIEVKNLKVKFPTSLNSLKRNGAVAILKNFLGIASDSAEIKKDEFWALDDVSFELRRGETLGLLGLNGSGKSTLLKVLNQLLPPDSGSVKLRGKVDALIELGAGFHPLFTGRENIKMRLALLGFNEEQIENLYQEIIEFSELGKFIDVPIKNYSSGMYSRLGFACAVFGHPDVLLVDEVLSVGDFRFRQKCLDKINSIKQQTSVVLVSHSLSTVKMFCDRCIVLDKGKLIYDGETERALSIYLDLDKKATGEKANKSFLGEDFSNEKKIQNLKVELVKIEARSASERSFLKIHISFQLLYKASKIIIGIPFWNSAGEILFSVSTDFDAFEVVPDDSGNVDLELCIDNILIPGEYSWVLAVHDGPEYICRKIMKDFSFDGAHPRIFGVTKAHHVWNDKKNKR